MEIKKNPVIESDYPDPDIIRVIRSPEFGENMQLIQQAVGGDTIDWSIANQRLRAFQNQQDGD